MAWCDRTDWRRPTPGLLLLVSGTLLSTAGAGVLGPEWSRPLKAAVVSTAVGANTFRAEKLYLLLADGRVLSVSASDTLREFGRAPDGATAIVALPTPARGASDIALLLTVKNRLGTSDLVAWNRNGQFLWKSAIPGMAKVDSLFYVGEGDNRTELCAWQRGEPWLIIIGKQLWEYTANSVRLKPGFTPRDALVVDFDGDGAPELAFFDGVRLAIYHVRQERELRCRWPEPDSTPGPYSAGPMPGPRLACAAFDVAPVMLVVTGDTLRYVNARTGDEERQVFPAPESGLPGPVAAVVARGPLAYVAGTDPQGCCYVARLNPSGLVRERLLLLPGAAARVNTLALFEDWPMLLVSTGYGPQNLLFCAPGLAGADNSTGYSGVRILRAVQLRIDEDTLADLAVLRTAGDARWRLDVFANRMGQIAQELEQARRELLRAALGQNDKAVGRAVRRVRALEREAGVIEAGQERSVVDRFRAAVQRRRLFTFAGTLAAGLLAAGLGVLWLRWRRRAAPGQQIEKQPVEARVALAADLIALDHNFMSKGNRAAAFERLIDIRNRHGLERDRHLGQSGRLDSQQLTGVYVRAINRLIDATPTLPLLNFILTTAKSAPHDGEVEFFELSPEELRRQERGPGVRLIALANHEYPEYHKQFRIFANPEVRGTLEHLILDHVRHSGTWADIILNYTVSTQWNRRLLVRFLSDSPHAIPLTDLHAHITSQLRELATLLRPAIIAPRDASDLKTPYEKLWISIADYIAVLEETRTRLSGA